MQTISLLETIQPKIPRQDCQKQSDSFRYCDSSVLTAQTRPHLSKLLQVSFCLRRPRRSRRFTPYCKEDGSVSVSVSISSRWNKSSFIIISLSFGHPSGSMGKVLTLEHDCLAIDPKTSLFDPSNRCCNCIATDCNSTPHSAFLTSSSGSLPRRQCRQPAVCWHGAGEDPQAAKLRIQSFQSVSNDFFAPVLFQLDL